MIPAEDAGLPDGFACLISIDEVYSRLLHETGRHVQRQVLDFEVLGVARVHVRAGVRWCEGAVGKDRSTCSSASGSQCCEKRAAPSVPARRAFEAAAVTFCTSSVVPAVLPLGAVSAEAMFCNHSGRPSAHFPARRRHHLARDWLNEFRRMLTLRGVGAEGAAYLIAELLR